MAALRDRCYASNAKESTRAPPRPQPGTQNKKPVRAIPVPSGILNRSTSRLQENPAVSCPHTERRVTSRAKTKTAVIPEPQFAVDGTVREKLARYIALKQQQSQTMDVRCTRVETIQDADTTEAAETAQIEKKMVLPNCIFFANSCKNSNRGSPQKTPEGGRVMIMGRLGVRPEGNYN